MTDAIIISLSSAPGFNLAAEEYLFSQCQDNVIFLYVNDPCVVIGCNQAVHAEVNLNYCRLNHIEVMRRISGGGAVYHDNGNLNYSVIRNREANRFPLNRDFLDPIISLLNGMDLPVTGGKRKDLWLSGCKVSGTASHIGKSRSLHHGTLLYDTDIERLKLSLAAESTDNPAGQLVCENRVSQANRINTQEAVKSISSVPSPVMNIRTYLEKTEKKTLPSTGFFQLLEKELLDHCNIAKIQHFSIKEETAIREIQQNTYQKLSWIYKK